MKKALKEFKIKVTDGENKELFIRKGHGFTEKDAIEHMRWFCEQNRLLVNEKFPITFEIIETE